MGHERYLTPYIVRKRFAANFCNLVMLFKSADYWHRVSVPQRIYDSLGPKMKFLVMLRDPVDRIHSDYSFNVSQLRNLRKITLLVSATSH